MGQKFHNTYEQSKCEAEELVRSYRDRLPISIFRPSVIAGHSKTGVTTTFSKVLYWPVRAFASGLVLCIPGDRDAAFDLVPVDFVSEALVRILEREDPTGRCYHLAAGRTLTLERGVQIAADLFRVRRIPPFVRPRLFYAVVRPIFYLVLWGALRETLLTSRVIVPYLASSLRFDTSNTRAALEGSGLELPDPESYFRTLLQYLLDTDFGGRLRRRAS